MVTAEQNWPVTGFKFFFALLHNFTVSHRVTHCNHAFFMRLLFDQRKILVKFFLVALIRHEHRWITARVLRIIQRTIVKYLIFKSSQVVRYWNLHELEERNKILQTIFSKTQTELVEFYRHLFALQLCIEIGKCQDWYKTTSLQLLLASCTFVLIASLATLKSPHPKYGIIFLRQKM